MRICKSTVAVGLLVTMGALGYRTTTATAQTTVGTPGAVRSAVPAYPATPSPSVGTTAAVYNAAAYPAAPAGANRLAGGMTTIPSGAAPAAVAGTYAAPSANVVQPSAPARPARRTSLLRRFFSSLGRSRDGDATSPGTIYTSDPATGRTIIPSASRPWMN